MYIPKRNLSGCCQTILDPSLSFSESFEWEISTRYRHLQSASSNHLDGSLHQGSVICTVLLWVILMAGFSKIPSFALCFSETFAWQASARYRHLHCASPSHLDGMIQQDTVICTVLLRVIWMAWFSKIPSFALWFTSYRQHLAALCCFNGMHGE